MRKLLSVVVPTYNMSKYLAKCLDSVLVDDVLEHIEVIVVNDGSKDDSASIAEAYVSQYPRNVMLINKENGGHGSAVNAGIDAATGVYVRILDADDWFDRDALIYVVTKLDNLRSQGKTVDTVVTNHVFEKQYDNSSKVMRFNNALPQNKIFTGTALDRLSIFQIIAMHNLIYRTQMLKDCGLRLQHNTFYVDWEYVYIPIPYIRTFIYFNVSLYRYLIGRPDQSVSVEKMIKQISHTERVVKRLVTYYDLETLDIPGYKLRHMIKVLRTLIMSYVTYLTMMDRFEGTDRKQEFFDWLKNESPFMYNSLCKHLAIKVMSNNSEAVSSTILTVFRVLKYFIKFS